MTDRFEEDLGKHTYVTLAQIKDYLSISSNTQDARLSNIINYATGVIEHYIGQEILANNYVEVFDGGKSSVFVNRLPLNNVYQVSEYNGTEDNLLADCTTTGRPVNTSVDDLTLIFGGNAHITSRIKKFGKSSLELATTDYIYSDSVPEHLQFQDSDFTVEMYVRVDEAPLQDNIVFSINTDASNYMQLRLANQYGLAFESNTVGSSTVVLGANTSIESQQFNKRKWAHIAMSCDVENERVYLHYNGNTIANSVYTVSNHTFTSNIVLGETFKGYVDEVRVSSVARYNTDFTAPLYRHRPDNDTVLLIHFDEKNNSTVAKDVHAMPSEYTFSRDSGEITRDVGSLGTRGTYPTMRNSYPALTLSGPAAFQPFPSGVRVEYRAGYEPGSVPYDLQLATLDFIKLLYKQDQEKKGFSFEGERGDSFPLAGNFPPHIRRILDLYRIIV